MLDIVASYQTCKMGCQCASSETVPCCKQERKKIVKTVMLLDLDNSKKKEDQKK